MAFIYDDVNVSVHIEEGNQIAEAKCFDLRDENMETAIKVDLLTMFPYLVDLEEAGNTPDWKFVIAAMESVHKFNTPLWSAWMELSKLPPIP